MHPRTACVIVRKHIKWDCGSTPAEAAGCFVGHFRYFAINTAWFSDARVTPDHILYRQLSKL